MSRLLLLLVTLVSLRASGGQEQKIGIIDFYGLERIPESAARQALTFHEGDTILFGDAPPAFLAESERRLALLPGVVRAHTNLVCCEAGREIVYVGIEEKGRATPHFRAAPAGAVRLPVEMVQAGAEFSEAFMAAVRRGDAGEDDSQGHALYHDPASRAIQERFTGFAAADLPLLRRVLHESSDAGQRALAAQILAYVRDKQSVVGDLVFGMSDASSDVRNNAMRALAVFAEMTPGAGRPIPSIPYEPFIGLLNSPVWTDRNKASLALMGLSERRDPALLAKLRGEAIAPLIEMARWKSEGHAIPALLILGRIGGRSDADTQAAWTRGEREAVMEWARRSPVR